MCPDEVGPVHEEEMAHEDILRLCRAQLGVHESLGVHQAQLDGGFSRVGRVGDVQVDALYPDGDGATNNFTPTGAGSTNADRVDETTPDSDTTYNEDATVNDVDLYTFAALPALPGTATVIGVQIVGAVKSDDGAAKSLALIARPVSTNRIGATQSISSAYLFYREISDVSPETSSAWTESEIDGAEFGIEVAA